MVDAETAEVTNNGKCIRESSCKRTGSKSKSNKFRRSMSMDITKKKQWKRHSAVSTVRMQDVSRAVLYLSIFQDLLVDVKEGNIEEAYKVIGESSALPAICGRVCPQESQCEEQMYPWNQR